MNGDSYGVQIWEWKKREGMERLADRYLRWVFGVDNKIPRYMVREELQREKVRERAGARAWGFEKKMVKGKGSRLAKT